MEFESYADVIDSFEKDDMGYGSLTDYINGENIKIKEIEMDVMGDLKKALSSKKDGGLMVAIQKFNQGGNVIDSRATTQDFTNALQRVSAGTTYQQQADAKRYARNQANQMLTNTMRSGNQANIQNLLQQAGGITSIPGMQFNMSGNRVTSIPSTGAGRDAIVNALANQMLTTTSYGGGSSAPPQKSPLQLKIEENKRLFDNYTKNNPATIDPAAALGGPGLMKTGAQLNTGTSIPEPAYMNKDLLSQLTMLTPEEAFAGETFDTLSDLDQYNFAQAFTQFQPQLRDSSYVSPYGPPGDQQIFNRRYGIRDGGMAGGKTYHQFHDQYVPIDEESMGYAYGGGVGSMMQPKRGLVNEPGGYAGEDNRSIGERIIDNGYFMRNERLAGPDDGSLDIGNIIDTFSRGISLDEKVVPRDKDLTSVEEIFQEDTPLTEGIFGLSEGFTLSPITMLRRYLANKELEKNNKKNGGRINFAGGGGDFMPLGYQDESIAVEDLTVPSRVGDFKVSAANALDDQTGLINSVTNIMSPGVNTIEGSLIDGDDPSSRYAVQQDFKSDRPFDRDYSLFDQARMGNSNQIPDRNRGQIIERAPSTPFDRGITMADIAGPSTIDRFSNTVGPVANVEATYQDKIMGGLNGDPDPYNFSQNFDQSYDASSDLEVPGMGKKAIDFIDAPVDFMKRANNPNIFDPVVNTKNFVQDGITTLKSNFTPKNIATSLVGSKIASTFGLPGIIGSFLARSLFGKKEDEFEGPYDDINNDGVIDRFDKARTTFGQSKNLKEYFEKVKAIKAQKEIKAQEAAERNRAETAAIQARVDRQYEADKARDGRDFSVSGPDTSANPRGRSNQASSERGYALHGAKGGIVPNGLSRKMTR